MKRFLWCLLAIPIVLILIGWVVLYSAIFNEFRSDLLERALSEEIGQPVVINGTVRIRPGTTLSAEVTDAVIPSAELPDQPLSELERLSLQAQVSDLLAGNVDFEGLVVRGLTINLIQREDGRNTWSVPAAQKSSEQSAEPSEATRNVGEAASEAVTQFFEAKTLLNYVLERSESFSDVQVQINDEESGFVFDYALEELTFERPEGSQTVFFRSSGHLNGQPFTSSSEYNREGPFGTRIDVGDLSLDFSGVNHPASAGGGYSSQLAVITEDIGDLLDVLRLERTLEGAGSFRVDISERDDVVELADIKLQLDFDSGRAFSASGKIGDFKGLDDVDIVLDLRLVPDPDALPPAETFADFQVESVSGRIDGHGGALTVEDAVLRTNAFDQRVSDFGPVSIGQLRRTPNDQLELSDVTLQAGPLDAPYIQARGEIRDGMLLETYFFEGEVNLPMDLVLNDLSSAVAEEFGHVVGGFSADDSAGFGRLRYFDLRTENTDLWHFRAHAESGDDPENRNFSLDLGLDITDEARFFEALELPSVNLTPFGFGLAATLDGSRLETQMDFRAGGSDLSAELALDRWRMSWRLGGAIGSSTLLLSDLDRLLMGLGALSDLQENQSKDAEPVVASVDQPPVQPLMLPEDEDTNRSLEALLAQEGVQPLVLPELDEPKLADLFDPDVVLRHMDVDITVAIERLAGVKGVTRIDSALTASDGRAQLAPIKFKYGDGSVDAQVEMNVIDAPDQVRVTGTAGGWDVAEAVTLIGTRLDASGIVSGSFDLTGQYDSARTFLNTMQGGATLRMSDGTIATSLLELAGLGIFPWLFSEERRGRSTTISCLVTPLRIDAGKVSTDRAVLETNQVQLVAQGALDWRRDSISLRAEARPVGRPLARSAWPFEVSGKLSEPEFKLQAGGSRVRREDGASTMPETRVPCVPDIAQLQGN